MSRKKTRVVQYGVGPIGAAIVRLMREKQSLEIVGAIDKDPAKAGRDLGEVVGAPDAPWGVPVSAEAGKVLGQKADVVVHCTSSYLKDVMDQLLECIAAGACIVSTCEELAYPFRKSPELSAKLDEEAKEWGVSLVGTGVNPGFVMDALPIMLTGVCERVDAIRVDRVQDAGIRRLPFQQKIGAGLTREQFQTQVDAGRVRHVGLAESVSMIADALGWRLTRVTDDIQPKIATETVSSELLAVDAGYVCGIVQDGVGYRGDEPVITLHMEAYLGAPESYDQVEIAGSPAIRSRIHGGVHGDIATASIVVNSLPRVLEVAPGLHTMRDMPLPSFFGGVR